MFPTRFPLLSPSSPPPLCIPTKKKKYHPTIMTQTKVCPTPPTPVSVVGTSNHAMVLISYACVGLTGVISLILILMHLFSFSAPKEQRQIIRIALVPLVTVAISCASIVAYDVSPYIKPIADLYEAFALASLFLLFVQFSVPSGTFGQELFDSMARAAAMDGDHRWAKVCNRVPS